MISVEIRFLSHHQPWKFFLIHENTSDRWGEVSGTKLLRTSHISLAKGGRGKEWYPLPAMLTLVLPGIVLSKLLLVGFNFKALA